MTWVKLDDGFPEHPKVLRAGVDAAWLYVCGLAYCNRHLTDGLIPGAIVPRLSAVSRPVLCANRLVSVGLWEREGEDFRVHDYHAENDPAEKVKAKRAATKERVRKWREKRDAEEAARNAGNADCNSVTDALVTPLVTPPHSDTATDTATTQKEMATLIESPSVLRFDFEAVYRRYPRKEGKKDGMAKCKARIKTQADFDLFAAAVDGYAAKIKREKTEIKFVMHFDRFAGGRWEDYVPGAPALALVSPPSPASPAPVVPSIRLPAGIA